MRRGRGYGDSGEGIGGDGFVSEELGVGMVMRLLC